jgi:hypothetical protein
VRVLPHVADAWSAGYLTSMPTGPRDFGRTTDLVNAGRAATAAWLEAGGLSARADAPQQARRSD